MLLCDDRRFYVGYRADLRGDDPGVSVLDEVPDPFVPVVPEFGSLLVLMGDRTGCVSFRLQLDKPS